jgi:hypothetical protein
MDRRGKAVVEFLECPDESAASRIEFFGKFERFDFNLADQTFNKARSINASPSFSSNRSRLKALSSRRGKSTGRMVWMCPLQRKGGARNLETRIGI